MSSKAKPNLRVVEGQSKEEWQKLVSAAGVQPLRLFNMKKTDYPLFLQSLVLMNFNHYIWRRLCKIAKKVDLHNPNTTLEAVTLEDILISSYLSYDYYHTHDRDDFSKEYIRCEISLNQVSYFKNMGIDKNLQDLMESPYYAQVFEHLKEKCLAGEMLSGKALTRVDLIRITDDKDVELFKAKDKKCKLAMLVTSQEEL